jgi:hypothetical protein
MGELFLQGVQASDVNIVLACLMVSSVIVVLFNLLADYGVLDPASARTSFRVESRVKCGQAGGGTAVRP